MDLAGYVINAVLVIVGARLASSYAWFHAAPVMSQQGLPRNVRGQCG